MSLPIPAPASPLARLRAAGRRLRERLGRAYTAALIGMLPARVDGKPRHWPVAPPEIHALPALLLRPYVWQIAMPITLFWVVRFVVGGIGLAEVQGAVVWVVFQLLFWSWVGEKLFRRHWTRLAIEAYNTYSWHELRDREAFASSLPPHASGRPTLPDP